MLRTLGLVLGLLLAAGSSANAQLKPSTPRDTAAAAEFPPYDTLVFDMQQRTLAAAAASRALAEAPDSVDTLALLMSQERIDDSLAVLKGIVERHPDRTEKALEIVAEHNSRFRDQARDFGARLQQILVGVRRGLAKAPREEAARVARQLFVLERLAARNAGGDAFKEGLTAFVREYSGTEAALLVEPDLIALGRVTRAQIAALDSFAHQHPGTVAGAKALYLEGFQLHVNVPMTGMEPRGSDPAERLLRVIEIVRELESGTFPKCEWIERAPRLVTGFFMSHPSIPPESVDRMIASYLAFVRTHFQLDPLDPMSNGVGYVITSKMAELFEMKGDRLGVERTLDTLATETGHPGVTYLKALFYIRTAQSAADRQEALLAKATETLRTLHEHRTGLYQRKALATLACLAFEHRDYQTAQDLFAKYLQLYPESAYAWLAALREGQSQESMAQWSTAAASYRAAAARYGSMPMAQIFGHEYAARALEAVGEFDEALREHESALRAWDVDQDATFTLFSRHTPLPGTPDEELRPTPGLKRGAISDRVERLRASLTLRGGSLLERERWLLQQQRWSEALDAFAELVAQFPESDAIVDGRYLSHRARLGMALHLANVERNDRDPDRASANSRRWRTSRTMKRSARQRSHAPRCSRWVDGRRLTRSWVTHWRNAAVTQLHPAPDRQPVWKRT